MFSCGQALHAQEDVHIKDCMPEVLFIAEGDWRSTGGFTEDFGSLSLR